MYRYEKKYIINRKDIILLNHRLSQVMELDPNAVNDGYYNIRSIYLDDFSDTSLHQVIAGISQREKFRIRIYDYDSGKINLEKKYKINNMTLKTSCRISLEQYDNIIKCTGLDLSHGNPKLLNEIYLAIKTKGYRPKIIIDYNRVPYIYDAGNVRITIDSNISCGNQYNNFFNMDASLIPFLDSDFAILEVKYDEFIPDHIRFALQLNKLTRTSYSKYANGRIELRKLTGE